VVLAVNSIRLEKTYILFEFPYTKSALSVSIHLGTLLKHRWYLATASILLRIFINGYYNKEIKTGLARSQSKKFQMFPTEIGKMFYTKLFDHQTKPKFFQVSLFGFFFT